jgi:predicted dienelactone hydrolase
LEPLPFLLSTPGAYKTGTRTITFSDVSRDDREVSIVVMYPAIISENQIGSEIQDAPADLTGAPYPIVLSSAKVAGIFGSRLASHGFISVGIRKMDYYEPWDQNLIDQPLDILFALDSIAVEPLDGLDGMLDSNRAGVMGYSFDGYNSLALSGVRFDPEFYLEQCSRSASMEPDLSEWRIWYFCDLAAKWDQFAAHAGSQITVSNDGLWQPMTDPRILAVMPMAPEGAWLFGERGLAAVDRPTLIIGATRDGICPYEMEAVYIFEHLDTPDRFMISFIGEGHMMIYDAEPVARMKHFATAFFGYYLQGRDSYAGYFSEDFVTRYDDLAWGVYKE